MPDIMVDRHKLVSVTSIFRFHIDVQKPNVSYMIHIIISYIKNNLIGLKYL